MYKPHCDTCGDLEFALVDGYNVRDRMLEDVWFRIKETETGFIAESLPQDGRYLSDFNMTKILKEIAEYASEQDLLTCPKCRADIEGPMVGA